MGRYTDEFNQTYQKITEAAERHPMYPGVMYEYVSALDAIRTSCAFENWKSLTQSPQYKAFTDSLQKSIRYLAAGSKFENIREFKDISTAMTDVFRKAAELRDVAEEMHIPVQATFESLDMVKESIAEGRFSPLNPDSRSLSEMSAETAQEFAMSEEQPEITPVTVMSKMTVDEYIHAAEDTIGVLEDIDKSNPEQAAKPENMEFKATLITAVNKLKKINGAVKTEEVADIFNDVINDGYRTGAISEGSYKDIAMRMGIYSEMVIAGNDQPYRAMTDKFGKYMAGDENTVQDIKAKYLEVTSIKREPKKPEALSTVFTQEQQKRYDFIRKNNEVIKKYFPDKVMSEDEMVIRTLDPQYQPKKDYKDLFELREQKSGVELQKLKQELGMSTPVGVARVIAYDLDMSGTPEAHEKNIALIKSVQTPEGEAEYINRRTAELASMKLEDFILRDADEAMVKFGKRPADYLTAFVIADFVNNSRAPMNPQIADFINKAKTTLQQGGDAKLLLRGRGSDYYGTMPDGIGAVEISVMMHDLNVEHGFTNLTEVKNVELEDYLQYTTATGNLYAQERERFSALAGTDIAQQPLYKVAVKDEATGKVMTLDDGIKVINNGGSISYQERPHEEYAFIEAKAAEKELKYLFGEFANREKIESPLKNEAYKGTTLDTIAEEDTESEEYSAEALKNVSPEIVKRFEFIKSNNDIVTRMFPEKALTNEQMLEMANDPEAIEKQKRAQKLLERGTLQKQAFEKAKDEVGFSAPKFGYNTDPGLWRVIQKFMDISGTPEAEENNRNFLKAAMTPEGQAKIYEETFRKILALDPKQYLVNDEAAALDAVEKDGDLLFIAFDTGFFSNMKSKLVDPDLKAEAKRISNYMAICGYPNKLVEAMASPYYKTMNPNLEVDEIIALSSEFMEHAQERIDAGYDLGSNGGRDVYIAEYANSVGAVEIFDEEVGRLQKAMEEGKFNDKPCMLNVYDSEGKLLPLSKGLDMLSKGENVTLVPRSKEEQAKVQALIDGETVNKANNARDWGMVYDNRLAEQKKQIEDEKKVEEAREKEFKIKADRFLDLKRDINKRISVMGYDMQNPDDLARFKVFEENEKGELVEKPLFVEDPQAAKSNLIASQIVVRNGDYKGYSPKRLEEILDKLEHGKVYFGEPGDTIADCMRISLDIKNRVKIKPAEEPENAKYAESEEVRAKYKEQWEDNKLGAEIDLETWGSSNALASTITVANERIIKESYSKGFSPYETIDKVLLMNRPISHNREKIEETLKANGINLDLSLTDAEKKTRAALSKEALRVSMEGVKDKFESIDLMDFNDDAVSDMMADRGLKALLLDGGSFKREDNEQMCRDWANADKARKSEIINERLEKLYGDGPEWYCKDRNDEEFLEDYSELFRQGMALSEAEAGIDSLLEQGISIKPEILEKSRKFIRVAMNAYAVNVQRIGLMASPYYSELNINELLTVPKAQDVLASLDDDTGAEYTGLVGKLGLYHSSRMMQATDIIAENLGVDKLVTPITYLDRDGNPINPDQIYDTVKNSNYVFAGITGRDDFKVFDMGKGTIAPDNRREAKEAKEAYEKLLANIVERRYAERVASNKPLADPEHVGRGLQNRYSELYAALDDVDPIFTKSSYEFATIKNELRDVMKGDIPQMADARESIEKINKLASDYLSKKSERRAAGNEINRDRFDAILKVYKATNRMLDQHEKTKDGNFVFDDNKKGLINERDLRAVGFKYPEAQINVSSLTPEQKAQRSLLRERLMKAKEAEMPYEDIGTTKVNSSVRFDKQFLMTLKRFKDDPEPTPEQMEENERIAQAMKNPQEHPEDAKKYMEKMYTIIANTPVYKAVENGLTPEAYIDNYRELRYYATLMGQIQNVDSFCNSNHIQIDQNLLDRAHAQMKYTNLTSIFNDIDSLVSNEYYDKFDIKDVNGTFLDNRNENNARKDDYYELTGKNFDQFDRFVENANVAYSVKGGVIMDAAMDILGVEVGSTNRRMGLIFPDGDGSIRDIMECADGLKDGREMLIFDRQHPEKMIRVPEGGFERFMKSVSYTKDGINILDSNLEADTSGYIGSEAMENVDKNYLDMCKNLLTQMAGADSMFTRSSDEFAGIKQELKRLNKLTEMSPKEITESADMMKEFAKTYIANKEGKSLSAYEQQRLNAVKEVLEVSKSAHSFIAINKGLEQNMLEEQERMANLEAELIERNEAEKQAEEARKAKEAEAQDIKAFENMDEKLKTMSILLAAPTDILAKEGAAANKTKLDLVEKFIIGGMSNLSDYEKERINLATAMYQSKTPEEQKKALCEGLEKFAQSVNDVMASQPDLNFTVRICGETGESIKKFIEENKAAIDRKHHIDDRTMHHLDGTIRTAQISESGQRAIEAFWSGNYPKAERDDMIGRIVEKETLNYALMTKAVTNKAAIEAGNPGPSIMQSMEAVIQDDNVCSQKYQNMVKESKLFNSLKSMDGADFMNMLNKNRGELTRSTIEVLNTVVHELTNTKAPAAKEAPVKEAQVSRQAEKEVAPTK